MVKRAHQNINQPARQAGEAHQTQERPERVSLANSRNILTVEGLPPNLVPRWVVDRDQGNRIKRFLLAGYKFVTDQNVTVGDRTVNADKAVGTVVSKYVGGGETAFLMAIERDLWNEDQAAKQAKIDEEELQMDPEYRQTLNEEERYNRMKVKVGHSFGLTRPGESTVED